MKILVNFLLLLYYANAIDSEYDVTCASEKNDYVSFEPSTDGVIGRYVLQWCVQINRTINEATWEAIVAVDAKKTRQECKNYNSRFDNSPKHSVIMISLRNLDCPDQVCMSAVLDLIFTGCYTIKNNIVATDLHLPSIPIGVTMKYVDNNISQSYFNNTVTTVQTESYQENIHIRFYTGTIPFIKYNVELCRTDKTNECLSVRCEREAAGATALDCWAGAGAGAGPRAGAYEAALQARAPWCSGVLFSYPHCARIVKRFQHRPGSERAAAGGAGAAREAGGAAAWGAGAGAAAALLAAAGAGALCVRRRRAALRRSVLAAWQTSYDEVAQQKAAEAEAAAGAARGGVLLLYARDCASLMKAAALLRDALRQATGGQVYDLHSADALAAMAPSPTEWLRAAVGGAGGGGAGLRVVLLETPLAAQLYRSELAPAPDRDELLLSAPLLPARVHYRQPQYSDTLLQYALQLLRETAHRHRVYKTYYFVTLSALPAALLPHVTPRRRHALPAHARALLADLAPPPAAGAPPPDTRPLERALRDHARFVAEHPDYARDLLVAR